MPPRNRPCRRAACLGALLSAMALAAGGPAAAQGVDHGALAQLFGEPVTTSATGKPQRASDVPVAMDIITAEQIRRSGARDIPEVLARYTSLDVQQYTAQDYTAGVRGFATPASSRVLVLLNGRQVYSDDFGQVVWATIPVQLTEIRQIEVVKGPNSALFGFNAAAGVINIITYSPLHDRVTNGTVRLGTRGYREASGVASARLGERGGVRLSAGLREENPWTRGLGVLDNALDGATEPSQASFAADGLFRLTDTMQAGFDASYSRTIGPELMTTGVLVNLNRAVWSIRGRISAETRYGLVEASVYRNAGDMELPRIGLAGRQSVTVVQLSDTVKLGARHTLRPFAEYRYNEGQIDRPGIDFSVGAMGLMWNWAATDSIETTAALRYDHIWLGASGYETSTLRSPFPASAYERDYGTLAWNLGLVWKPGEFDSVRLSAARGIGTPALIQLGPPGTRAIPELGLGIANSPILRPTVVDNYELGYRRRIGAIDGRVEASAFYQMNRGLNSGLSAPPTIFPPAAPLPTAVPINIGGAHAYGAELSGTGRLGRGFDWDLRYRLVLTEASLAPVPLEYKHASPRHLLVARLGWAQGPFEADLFGRYATALQGWRLTETGYRQVQVEDVVSLAARLAYRLTDRFTLALEGSNILHQRQRLGIGLEAERQIYLSLRADL